MAIETVNPLDDMRWPDLVARSPAGSIFHHPAWLSLLVRHYGYAVTATGVADEDGRLIAGLPVARVQSRVTGRRLVALPFSDVCPPLVAGDAPPAAAAELGAGLDARRREQGLALEVRGGGEDLPGAVGAVRFHHHLLELQPDVRAVERGFAKSQIARGIRRARREGLVVTFARDRAALARFYRLHMGTRRRLGVPTQPRRFILGFEPLLRGGLGFVATVLAGRRPVAAAVFLVHDDVLTYKYGASDEAALSMRPNNLLFMEAIRWGCENGMRTLDFGKTHLGQEGLRAFKRAWGSTEHELRYHRLGDGGPGRRIRDADRLLVPLIRHAPAPVGRAIGELFYRHAA